VTGPRIFSTPAELEKIKSIIRNYARLPFAVDTVPGSLMEGTLADIRKAEVLKTYDFVDVLQRAEGCGWQVKSTKGDRAESACSLGDPKTSLASGRSGMRRTRALSFPCRFVSSHERL